MDAEHLVAIANARGVDLKNAVGATIETKGTARKRDRTKLEKELGISVQETAGGRHSRTYRRPDWSLAELARAAAAGGVKGCRWLAVRYSIAGDASVRDELCFSLGGEALLLGRRERWPMKVDGLDGKQHFFRERLAELMLTEDAHRHYFAAAPVLYAVCMSVAPAVWDRSLSSPFRSLKTVYEGWLTRALAGISRGLRGQ